MEKQISFAEANGKKPFNWHKFIELGILDQLTQEQKEKGIMLAKSWVTCACGNQCKLIPREEFIKGRPDDDILYSLGNLFAILVKIERYESAKFIIKKIEKRSSQIINEINLQNGK